MRLAGRRTMVFGVLLLIAGVALAGCQNPLNPIDRTERIKGLSFIDFSATWERWDSDPQFDGLIVNMDYFNEFGDSLAFHDKPHNIVIEFWSQDAEEDDSGNPTFVFKDKLLFSRTIEFSNSDDDIRIPIEAYFDAIDDAGIADETSGEAKGFMVVRVFPPEEFPRPELLVGQPDIVFFKPELEEDSPNE